MEKQYILSLDQGTTSSRAILFDDAGRIITVTQKEFSQGFPSPGQVEHDPLEIWSSQLQTAQHALASSGVDPGKVAAIGMTNQRETTVVWDRKSGEPVYQAIVWQDRRTAARCNALKREGLEAMIREKTGLVIDAYFSASKLQWILEHVEGARRKADRGELLFGTVDTWLLYKLTGGQVHATDYSNASRTMLYNIREKKWDPDLCTLFGVPESMLPEVRDSSGMFGVTDPEYFGRGIPITGIAGDQQAALFGQLCHTSGMAKNTYGTGCFVLLNTGDEAVASQSGLLTTMAWGLKGEITYALEGSVFIGGAVIQWLRDGLEIIEDATHSEALARSVPDSGGVAFVPAFTGLGTPHWDMFARGGIFGLTRGTTRAHIVRAALESIALQSRDVLNTMVRESALELSGLRVDGGASANNFLMQFQSDILDVPIRRPKNLETTAMGAAYLAGLATGTWTEKDLESHWELDRIFHPAMGSPVREDILKTWEKGVRRVQGWLDV